MLMMSPDHNHIVRDLRVPLCLVQIAHSFLYESPLCFTTCLLKDKAIESCAASVRSSRNLGGLELRPQVFMKPRVDIGACNTTENTVGCISSYESRTTFHLSGPMDG